MNKKLSLKFGDVVRQLRMARGWSQEKLAEKGNVHRTYIGMIERGERNITLENINKIASALQVPMKKLFEKLEKTK
jgi:transcriptional regulator with XRE-family HTH domain